MPRKKKSPETQSFLSDLIVQNDPWEDAPLYGRLFKKERPRPFLSRKDGYLFQADALRWLKTVADKSVDLVFADPPYDTGRAKSSGYRAQETVIRRSMEWIAEAARVLKPSGTLVICGFTEILADLKHPASRCFRGGCKWLIWYYKNRANTGTDWGRSHESLLVLRKSKRYTMNLDAVRVPYQKNTLRYPPRPREGNGWEDWSPNPLGAKPKDVLEIPIPGGGLDEKNDHPAQKPEELLRKIILAASREGEIVLDPFSGSGTTLAAARQLGRKWVGCEIRADYNELARQRIDFPATRKTVEEWIQFDKAQTARRAKK